MAEVYPIVSDLSIGNALVAIDCVNLKCIESVEFSMRMEEVPIICDWAAGPVTTLRGNPNGEITIMAANINSTTLKYALDADAAAKAADETVSCEEHQITWTPDDVATPTEWTATVVLHSPEVEDVQAFDDSSCLVAWNNAATPENTIAVTDSCTGTITLTTDDVDEALTTLYFAYTHNTETPVGATLIKPEMATFADDHKVHILHRNATTCELMLIKFWRCQIIPDFTMRFDNTNAVRTVPIRLRVLSAAGSHPCAPLGQIVLIDKDDSEAGDFTAQFYKDVRACVTC